jgi:hypothetical protein
MTKVNNPVEPGAAHDDLAGWLDVATPPPAAPTERLVAALSARASPSRVPALPAWAATAAACLAAAGALWVSIDLPRGTQPAPNDMVAIVEAAEADAFAEVLFGEADLAYLAAPDAGTPDATGNP